MSCSVNAVLIIAGRSAVDTVYSRGPGSARRMDYAIPEPALRILHFSAMKAGVLENEALFARLFTILCLIFPTVEYRRLQLRV